ncbi:MAG: DUF1552 domain-containing protein [Bryobacterales bacterium]|nr:DUF1552 domain-containing protein [Bryobacterales bacterium]
MSWKESLGRRTFLKGIGAAGLGARVGLPAFDALFNSHGTAYAAAGKVAERAPESRFVLWFNGNGVPERYWIPANTGREYTLTPCLRPLAPFRDDIHIITGLDNPAARMPGPGNDHHRSMSGLMTGTSFTGRGAGGPSFDQVVAGRIGGASRFRSLQIGVCQESHGESIQRNMSWAGYDRALPPELIPQNLFDRLFGAKDLGWVNRKKSILDAVREEAAELESALGAADKARLDEHLSSIRDLERAIASLPPEYKEASEPDAGGDLRDYPRIAKIQSDLLVQALATGQTRVASYMLTKCQSLVRMPWLGYTALRHHDYTHTNSYSPEAQRIMRDICRWHVEEFAYFLAKLRSVREGDRTLLDSTLVLFVHEHAEANIHKNNGLPAIIAGHTGGHVATGLHTKTTGTMAELYLSIANDIFDLDLESVPTAAKKLPGIIV